MVGPKNIKFDAIATHSQSQRILHDYFGGKDYRDKLIHYLVSTQDPIWFTIKIKYNGNFSYV